eukprot:4564947-Pleurochrysis_carterae.AAC.1
MRSARARARLRLRASAHELGARARVRACRRAYVLVDVNRCAGLQLGERRLCDGRASRVLLRRLRRQACILSRVRGGAGAQRCVDGFGEEA